MECLREAERVVAEHGPSQVSVARTLALMREFGCESPEVRAWPSRSLAVAAFLGWLRLRRAWPSSIVTHMENTSSFSLDPRAPDEAEERVRFHFVQQAFRRLQGVTGPKFVKLALTDDLVNKILSTPDPEAGRRRKTHLLWQALFWLTTATGGRPASVRVVRGLQLRPDALLVKWGPRKVQVVGPTDFLEYPFAWTGCPQPPVAVCGLLMAGVIPALSNRRNVAASMNSWIKSLGLGRTRSELTAAGRANEEALSSCSARVRVANRLMVKVESGELSETMYKMLLDHRYDSARLAYARIAADAESDDDA